MKKIKCKDCRLNNTEDCRPPTMDYGEDEYFWYCEVGEKHGRR